MLITGLASLASLLIIHVVAAVYWTCTNTCTCWEFCQETVYRVLLTLPQKFLDQCEFTKLCLRYGNTALKSYWVHHRYIIMQLDHAEVSYYLHWSTDGAIRVFAHSVADDFQPGSSTKCLLRETIQWISQLLKSTMLHSRSLCKAGSSILHFRVYLCVYGWWIQLAHNNEPYWCF
jgi:hypothetical protein